MGNSITSDKYLFIISTLIYPTLTFSFFNLLKSKIYHNYIFDIIELSFMVIATNIVFNNCITNICKKSFLVNTNINNFYLNIKSVMLSLFLLLLCNSFLYFYSCKEYMSLFQINIFYFIIMFFLFNIIQLIISSSPSIIINDTKKDQTCVYDYKISDFIFLILLILLHIGLIYINNKN